MLLLFSSSATPATPTSSYLPTYVAGCILWADGQDSSTITQSAGSISRWNDKSGYGNHLSQATTVNMPTVTPNAINGSQALLFSGSQGIAKTSGVSFPASTAYSIFVVATNTLNTATESLFAGSNVASPGQPLLQNVGGALRLLSTNASAIATAPAGSFNGTGDVLEALIASGSTVALYHTGNQDVSTTTALTTLSLTAFNVGSASGASSWRGYIGEVLVYNAVLSTFDRQTIEGYLAWRWGLQTQLPSGHPYYSAAPTIPLVTQHVATAGSMAISSTATYIPATTALASSPTVGNWLVAFFEVSSDNTHSINQISASGWVLVTAAWKRTNEVYGTLWARQVQAGDTGSFAGTISTSGAFTCSYTVEVLELVGASGVFDIALQATAAATMTATQTPPVAGCLQIAEFTDDTSDSPGLPAGFTALDTPSSTGGVLPLYTTYAVGPVLAGTASASAAFTTASRSFPHVTYVLVEPIQPSAVQPFMPYQPHLQRAPILAQ